MSQRRAELVRPSTGCSSDRFRSSGRALAVSGPTEGTDKRSVGRPTAAKTFWQGFILQASNPKNLAFFVAILPQFIVPEGNVPLQLFIMGVLSVLLELPILIFYGFASAKSAAALKERVITWIEGVAGGLLIAMGAALALYRRAP